MTLDARLRLLGSLLVVSLLTACSTTPPRETRESGESRDGRTSPSAPAPEEALRFGGISVPASGKVLGTQYDRGIDERYRVVVGLPAGDVTALLSASQFKTALTPHTGPLPDSVDGFDLTKAKSLRAGEDSRHVEGHTVYRRVTVDDSDPATAVVHLSLFTM